MKHLKAFVLRLLSFVNQPPEIAGIVLFAFTGAAMQQGLLEGAHLLGAFALSACVYLGLKVKHIGRDGIEFHGGDDGE